MYIYVDDFLFYIICCAVALWKQHNILSDNTSINIIQQSVHFLADSKTFYVNE